MYLKIHNHLNSQPIKKGSVESYGVLWGRLK